MVRSTLLPAQLAQAAIAHELAVLLIPEAEGERLEAGEQRDRLDVLEQGIGLVASLQVVVRNPRAEVVNVVESDVAREPLQDPGQLVERAALQRGRGVVPGVATLPVDTV